MDRTLPSGPLETQPQPGELTAGEQLVEAIGAWRKARAQQLHGGALNPLDLVLALETQVTKLEAIAEELVLSKVIDDDATTLRLAQHFANKTEAIKRATPIASAVGAALNGALGR